MICLSKLNKKRCYNYTFRIIIFIFEKKQKHFVGISRIAYNTKRTILNLIAFFYDFFIFNSAQNITAKPTILVIKMDAIGDFFVWLSVANHYKDLFPASKYNLYLLTNPACKVMAEKLGFFDQVIGIKRKKFILNYFYRLKFVRLLNSIKYETIIYHASSREFASGDLLVRKLSSNNKISIKSDTAVDSNFWINISNRFYTKCYNLDMYSHEIAKNNAFLEYLGKPKTKLELVKLQTNPNVIDSKKYIVIATGARIGIRKWPIHKFIEVINFILDNTNYDIILTGAKEDVKDGFYVENLLKNVRIINKINKTSVLVLADLIAGAAFLVGNETANIHIAAAVQTKSICILGGGHFDRFVPYPNDLISDFKPIPVFFQMDCYGCNWRCKYQVSNDSSVLCIQNIDTQKVINQIKLLLINT